MPKKYSDETKKNAIILYLEEKMTVTEIADSMGFPRSTVDGWLKSITSKNRSVGQRQKSKQMKEQYQSLRDNAYEEAWKQAPELFKDPLFRDFINLYLGEGYKKSVNDVAIANSNPNIMSLAQHFMLKLANPDNKMEYNIQYHMSQNEHDLKEFWGSFLNIAASEIRTLRISTSDPSTGRKFNSKHGVLTIRIGDTYFHSHLQAWMDYLRKLWLDKY